MNLTPLTGLLLFWTSNPSLPGSPLVLYDMPWTHSLPGAFAWSLGGALLARYLLKVPWRAAVFIGLVVFSHWLADLLVHRPDLLLWPEGPKVGLGLWNAPVAEQAVEIGLLAVAGVFWTAWRVRTGRKAWPAALFLALASTAIGADYVASVEDHYQPEARRPWHEVVEDVRAAVQREIAANGTFIVRGDSGAFVCR